MIINIDLTEMTEKIGVNSSGKEKTMANKPSRCLLLILTMSVAAISNVNGVLAQEKSIAVPAAPAKALKISIPGMHYCGQVPVNFPVPFYPSNVVHQAFVNSTKGQPKATLSLVTKDEPSAVFQWYMDRVKEGSWKVQVPSASVLSATGKAGKLFVMHASKEGQKLDVFCFANRKDAGTTVDINFVKD